MDGASHELGGHKPVQPLLAWDPMVNIFRNIYVALVNISVEEIYGYDAMKSLSGSGNKQVCITSKHYT